MATYRYRAIVETVPSSESLARLTHLEERLFWRVLSQTDSRGRFYGDATRVKAECLPTVPVRVSDVERALEALVRVDLIRFYFGGARRYLFVVNFDTYQPRDPKRGTRQSPFPEPDENSLQMTMPHETETETETSAIKDRRADATAQLTVEAANAASTELSALADARPNAQVYVAAYIDLCRERGVNRPPERVIGQLSRELRLLVAEGQPEEAIFGGIRIAVDKALSPSQLASCVQQAQLERRGAAPSQGKRFGRGLTAADAKAQTVEAAREGR